VIERWLPLGMLLVWGGLARWRIRIHWRRTGKDPVFFFRDRDPAQRIRDALAAFGTGVVFVIAVLAGLERVGLAEQAWQRSAGIVLGFGGAVAMFAAQRNMGDSWRIGIDPTARTALVTNGWYSVCRNPIYASIYAGYLGFALLVPNVVTWTIAVLLLLGLRSQILREERWLAENHGDAWRAYAARTGRFVPFVGRLRA
jgi:protein-S-isoprenylcysteine O-methyltransferase Ste14